MVSAASSRFSRCRTANVTDGLLVVFVSNCAFTRDLVIADDALPLVGTIRAKSIGPRQTVTAAIRSHLTVSVPSFSGAPFHLNRITQVLQR